MLALLIIEAQNCRLDILLGVTLLASLWQRFKFNLGAKHWTHAFYPKAFDVNKIRTKKELPALF